MNAATVRRQNASVTEPQRELGVPRTIVFCFLTAVEKRYLFVFSGRRGRRPLLKLVGLWRGPSGTPVPTEYGVAVHSAFCTLHSAFNSPLPSMVASKLSPLILHSALCILHLILAHRTVECKRIKSALQMVLQIGLSKPRQVCHVPLLLKLECQKP